MRILITCLAVSSIIVLSILSGQAHPKINSDNSSKTAQQAIKPAIFTDPSYKPGIIRHIVLLRYKPEVSVAQRRAILERFVNMKSMAVRDGHPYILSIHAGAQKSTEDLGQGFDQVFIVKFQSEGDRNYYIGTPAVTDPAFYDPNHEKLKNLVNPLLADNGVLVFDFTSTK